MLSGYGTGSSPLTDEELVKQYLNGDNTSLLHLISRYVELIDRKLGKYGFSSPDQEDIKQEALISFMDAIRSYRFDLGVKFSTYANRCIDNSIKNSLAKLNTKKAKLLSAALSIEDAGEKDILQLLQNNPEQIYIDKEKYQNILTVINTNLSDFEKNVLYHYLDGDFYLEIAELLGTTPKAVDNALQRVRKKLKALRE